MTRTKMLAVVGVVLLVALAGCGGTDPENVSEPNNGTGAIAGGETTEAGGFGAETTTEEGGLGAETTTEEGGLGEETTTEEGGLGEETTTEEGGLGEETTTEEGGLGEENTTEEGDTGPGGAATDPGNDSASGENVTTTFDAQTSNGSAIVVQNVTLPNGGFVGVHNTTEQGEPDSLLGNTSYLDAGTYENLTVGFENTTISGNTTLVVMLYQDTNDNQMYDYPGGDSPYLVDGTPVLDNASVTVSTENVSTNGGAGNDTGNATDDGTGNTTEAELGNESVGGLGNETNTTAGGAENDTN